MVDYALLRVLVMAAPPTPNGDLHVGHLSGPYLAGDIHSRYLRLRGAQVHFFSGTDDNQSDVRISAAQIGLAPQQTADIMAEKILATLLAARIDLDQFIRPNASPWYVPIVQGFLLQLCEQEALVVRTTLSPYCNTCQQQLYENYISGRCPHCGSLTTGSGCEGCGLPNQCIDLLGAACTRCGSPPSSRLIKRLYFPLSQYSTKLREYWSGVAMSPNLRSLCEHALQIGLSDVAVSHFDDWGVPVPIPGFEGQTVFTWFDEAARYLAYAQHLGDKWERFWKAEDTAAIQCFGFDNAFYYAVLVPALLMAFDSDIRLPSALLMNEFRLLDEDKFSTSRRHAIWGRDLLSKVPADALRFYLAATYPEAEKTRFSLAHLTEKVDRELIDQWQPWLSELAARMRREFGYRVPAAGEWTEQHRRFLERLKALASEARKAYEARAFSPQHASCILSGLVHEARRFAKSEESWLRVAAQDERRRTAVALELLAAKLLAFISAPILPDFAERLWQELGFQAPIWEHRWENVLSLIPKGQSLRNLAASGYFLMDDTKCGSGAAEFQPTVQLALEGSREFLHIRPETTDFTVYCEIFVEKPHVIKLDRPPNVIIDGGANIGASSVDFALRYPDARIIAIEPEEQNFQLLVKNAKPFLNIFPMRAALWREETNLAILDGGTGAWGFQRVEELPGAGSILQTVPAVTVDQVMEEYGISFIDILKLDIEGSEVEVLESSAPWVHKVEILIIELHEEIRPDCRRSFEIAVKDFVHESTNGDKIICRRKVARMLPPDPVGS